MGNGGKASGSEDSPRWGKKAGQFSRDRVMMSF